MTCVWDSIISALSDLFRKADNGSGLIDIISPIFNQSDFIKFCEKHSEYMKSTYTSILINNNPVTSSEVDAYIKRIKELDQIDKQNGYNVGVPDSFLLFICIFFRINIIHEGQAHYVTIDGKPYSPSMSGNKHQAKCEYRAFTHNYVNINGTGEWIKLNSSTSHMSYSGSISLADITKNNI
jgi:hypothetical protein